MSDQPKEDWVFFNINKVELKSTNDALEMFTNVLLLSSSVMHDRIMSGEYQFFDNDAQMIICSLNNIANALGKKADISGSDELSTQELTDEIEQKV